MKSATTTSGILAALLVVLTTMPAAAQDKKNGAQSPPSKEPSATASVPVYKPPLRGAPGGRVGGGTRGSGNARDVFILSALAPDHMGLTAAEQPSLYWFISSPTSLPVEMVLEDPRRIQPVIEARLTSPVQAGVHKISLSEHGVQLTPGVAYRWSVTVIPDANRRSRDILASATVERIEPPEEVRTKLAQARKEELPFFYAEAGLWYDALATISDLIDRAPQDMQLRQQRAALLRQVGLPDIGEGKP